MYGLTFPTLADTSDASVVAVAAQLERSQWWSADELARVQRTQRDAIVAHAAASVPLYRGITDWASVPILTRAQIIAAGDDLLSRKYPATHGPADEVMTSRTSGEAVRVRGTAVIAALWAAVTLRDHAWHRRDVTQSLAAIRYTAGHAPAPDGARVRGWSGVRAIAPDAPLHVLSVASTTDEQIAWLARVAPTYLLIYPTVLDALLQRLVATGARLPSIRDVRTISEVLSPATRARCLAVLGLPIVDTYSAQEVGYIALQCPDREHYHVQAERLIVEILRDDGTACEVGETGRVVVTDLHNFATPILRYELGDFAEVGAPCACGRGLPVLTRVVGRRRNMLAYPDGRTVWPVFAVACREATRFRDLQLVQPSPERLVARVVPDGELDRAALVAAIRRAFDHPFEVDIELVDAVTRTPAGKLEEFVSHVIPLR